MRIIINALAAAILGSGFAPVKFDHDSAGETIRKMQSDRGVKVSIVQFNDVFFSPKKKAVNMNNMRIVRSARS